MKKALKFFLYFFLGIIGLLLITGIGLYVSASIKSSNNMARLGEEAFNLAEEGHPFRDLNKNGKLDTYEDSRQNIEARIEDLLSQMNLEEKAGMMFISMIGLNEDGSLSERPSLSNPFSLLLPSNSEMVARLLINHFNITFTPDLRNLALWQNNIQKLAERTRLGIPVTIASDPRHAFSENVGAALTTRGFSRWCEPIGLAATRDSALVAEFGNIARQEYRAVGIHLALHPMADLATEPRWARVNGTFGEDAALSAQMLQAYILGFQGDSLTSTSVACMLKHFPGGGPQKDGLDAHFDYGKDQVYPGNNFDYHLIPFEGAFKAHPAQIMPYYGVAIGQTSEDVGFAFNKEIITHLLRNKYGFEGVVCTDWGVISDWKVLGRSIMKSRGWGLDELSPEEKMIKALDAGVDQFGGEYIPELLVKLVKEGKLSESRLDISVRCLLRDKFKLGLFDDPYLDIDAVHKIVGKAEFREAGELAQRKSIILLKNGELATGKTLPINNRPKIYVENVELEAAEKYAEVVATPEEADLAILRLNCPYQPRSGTTNFLENFFHQGDLDFKTPEKERILDILQKVPTIVDIYLERPAVIPEITDHSAALLANFGANDEAVLDVIFGKFNPTAKLPFELPSSMEAVEKQMEDVPYDSENPLFEFGHGLRYDP